MRSSIVKGWAAAGVVLLVLATLVMGWFAGRLLPIDPMPRPEDAETAFYPGRFETEVRAGQTVDVAFGEKLLVEGVTQGKKYLLPSAKQTEPPCDGWLIECGACELSVSETRVVSGDALRELDPRFPWPATSWDSGHIGSELAGKAFVVTLTVRNPSNDERVELPEFTLWSDAFNRRSDAMGNGAFPLYGAFDALLDRAVTYRMVLEPGETREVEAPFYIFRNSFADESAFENVDLAGFCLEVNDYDPGICYRFWLAERLAS
ncbi:hypothetical protein C1878_04335 [Gordonibacter sp. 28C]|uniref:hypothetical protein n=1 Tax=Gordonibacter sp. 28C TaxID=2078569 RepID=UPI000DF7395D|nr:hypothetical protein [Gordonibacter sp. 28C]RDB63106.1 hypothetical protein C1878_04335 [Gordonibacter sp. 28C]